MGIVHIVLFSFKPLATADEVQGVCSRMLALGTSCVHPQTGKPYIKTAIGGVNNSPEGISHGISHAFISEFESEEDRAYYLDKDPAHETFKKSIVGIVEKVQVVDFSPGVL